MRSPLHPHEIYFREVWSLDPGGLVKWDTFSTRRWRLWRSLQAFFISKAWLKALTFLIPRHPVPQVWWMRFGFFQWIPEYWWLLQNNFAIKLSILLAMVFGMLKTPNWWAMEAMRMELMMMSLTYGERSLLFQLEIREEIFSNSGVKCWTFVLWKSMGVPGWEPIESLDSMRRIDLYSCCFASGMLGLNLTKDFWRLRTCLEMLQNLLMTVDTVVHASGLALKKNSTSSAKNRWEIEGPRRPVLIPWH